MKVYVKVHKQLISIILSINLVGSSISISCARTLFLALPGNTELIEIKKESSPVYIKVKKGYVHIKNLETGETEIISRNII